MRLITRSIQGHVGILESENDSQPHSYHQRQLETLQWPKYQSKGKAIAEAENEAISHDTGEGTQRPVVASEQVISQIKPTHNIAYGPGDANAGDDMAVYNESRARYPHEYGSFLKEIGADRRGQLYCLYCYLYGSFKS
jgi:hypothetical protein